MEFIEDGHVYRLDGEFVPSVTQLVGRRPPVDQETLELAGQVGTEVHQVTAWADLGAPVPEEDEREYGGYLEQWKRALQWLVRNTAGSAEILWVEKRLASRRYQYAGTADRVLCHERPDGVPYLTVVDIKTGLPSDWHTWQVGLYMWCLMEAWVAPCAPRVGGALVYLNPERREPLIRSVSGRDVVRALAEVERLRTERRQ